MVAPAGFGLSEVGDVEVFPHGEEVHLFHLTLPNHDLVHHAVSHDGLSWTPLPPALRTGDPGACDDDMIWTMSVTERGGRFYMVYTALALAEGGRVQRTALAISDDLLTWIKHEGNPVAAADPRWYETEPDGRAFVSWRDPKPILVGDTYFATVNARENVGPVPRRGCVGLLSSPDLVRWQVRPPLFAPRLYYDLECPQVFTIDGRYYLTAAIMEDRTQRYWMADQFEGPYRSPAGGNVLAPAGHYAGRVCHWRGQTLFFCWHRGQNDWPGIRNPAGKFIVPPLALEAGADGRLHRRPFAGWASHQLGTAADLPSEGSTLLCRHPSSSISNGWRVNAPDGHDILAAAPIVHDARLTGALRIEGAAGGLAVRLGDDATGYFVALTPGSTEVVLRKWLPGQRMGEDSTVPWFRYAEVQRGHLARPLAPGETLPIQVVLAGPYIEVALDGEVVLAAVTGERLAGRLGPWTECGATSLDKPRLAPLRRPSYRATPA